MWADIRPDVVKTITTEQTAQAESIARRLHVPERRASPSGSPSRSSSQPRTPVSAATPPSSGLPSALFPGKVANPTISLNEGSPQTMRPPRGTPEAFDFLRSASPKVTPPVQRPIVDSDSTTSGDVANNSLGEPPDKVIESSVSPPEATTESTLERQVQEEVHHESTEIPASAGAEESAHEASDPGGELQPDAPQ